MIDAKSIKECLSNEQKKVIIVVMYGVIYPEFVVSICKLTAKFPDIEVVTGVQNPSIIDISKYKCVVFMRPEISFPVSAIESIIDDSVKNKCVSGIAVPCKRVNFEKTQKILNSGNWNEDIVALERLSSEFTITTSSPISLDSSAVMHVTRYQNHDIVCIEGSLKNDFDNGFIHNKFQVHPIAHNASQ